MDKTRTIIAGIVSGVSLTLIGGGMIFGMVRAQSDSERLGYFTAAIPAALTILAVWVNPPGRSHPSAEQAISQEGGLQVNVAPDARRGVQELPKKNLLT